MFNLEAYCLERRRDIDEALERHLPGEYIRPSVLHRAMRYSVLAGGKRLRPILCLAACEAVGGRNDEALWPALALEILHTYTLVHDDLPCMDNDELRRGKPTAHVVFGEANALLAGDALLTMAFEWVARCTPPPPHTAADLIMKLAEAAGSRGVIAGQVEDLAAEKKNPSAADMEFIHRHKTAALIEAAVCLGGMAGGGHARSINALSRYGQAVGLAFQIADDILNETSSREALGKATGSDKERGKMTSVAVWGMQAAREHAERFVHDGCRALDDLPGNRAPLEALARYSLDRQQ